MAHQQQPHGQGANTPRLSGPRGHPMSFQAPPAPAPPPPACPLPIHVLPPNVPPPLSAPPPSPSSGRPGPHVDPVLQAMYAPYQPFVKAISAQLASAFVQQAQRSYALQQTTLLAPLLPGAPLSPAAAPLLGLSPIPQWYSAVSAATSPPPPPPPVPAAPIPPVAPVAVTVGSPQRELGASTEYRALPCRVCGVVLRSEASWSAHLKSRRHRHNFEELEQRTVVLKGLPSIVPADTWPAFFQQLDVPEGSFQVLPLETPAQQERPAETVTWQAVLTSPEEARRVASMSPVPFGSCIAAISLATQLHHCAACNLTVNSAAQLEEHVTGTRHLRRMKRVFAKAHPTLATDTNRPDPGASPMQVATSSNSAIGTLLLPSASPPSGSGVPSQPSSEAAPSLQRVPKAGVKTAEDVHLLVCSLLHANRVIDVQELPATLFRRIFTLLMSCKPYPFLPLRPRSRFFAEFDARAGPASQLSLLDILAILAPMDQDWAFQLPPGAASWFTEKLSKYACDPKTGLLSKSSFIQIRNLKWITFQAVQKIVEKLAANAASPPVLLHTMSPLSPIASDSEEDPAPSV